MRATASSTTVGVYEVADIGGRCLECRSASGDDVVVVDAFCAEIINVEGVFGHEVANVKNGMPVKLSSHGFCSFLCGSIRSMSRVGMQMFSGLVSHGESVAALSGSVEPSSTSLVSLDGIGRECQCFAECNLNH